MIVSKIPLLSFLNSVRLLLGDDVTLSRVYQLNAIRHVIELIDL